MDLQHPERKMSKSVSSPLGTVQVLDEPAELERKIKRAVTDTDGEVRYDPDEKPGVSNLLELLAVTTDRSPVEVASGYQRYGDLKRDVAESLIELLRPVRERRKALAADPEAVAALLAVGADKAACGGRSDLCPGRRGHGPDHLALRPSRACRRRRHPTSTNTPKTTRATPPTAERASPARAVAGA